MKAMRRCAFGVIALALLSAPVLRQQSSRDDARLPDAAYPDVVALREAGRPTEALAALDRLAPEANGEAPIAATVLRARLLSEVSESARSAALWDDIRARAPLLEAMALGEAAHNYVRSGELDRAEFLLADESARRYGTEWAALASAYRRAGQAARAAEHYRRVIAAASSGALADSATLDLAETLEESGDHDGALALLTALQLRFRESSTFERARSESQRLERMLGRTEPPFTDTQYHAVADRLRNRSMFDAALAVLDDWRQAYPASAVRAEALSIDTLYRARSNAEARARAAAFLDRHPESALGPDVRVLLYRLDVREGRTANVRTRGQALWTGGVPGISPSDRLDLGRLLAAYLVSVGEVEEGLEVYRGVYQASSSPEMQIDIMWRVSVAAIRAGQLDRAEANLQALGRRRLGRTTSMLVEYWTAALAELLGRRDEAVRLFTALARREPYDYYGIRARERLTALGAAVPDADPQRSFPPMLLRPPTRARAEFRAAELLARAGLTAEAAELTRRLAGDEPGDRALALTAARASAAAGDHRQAVALMETRFGPFIQAPASGLPDDFWELAYPRAFWDDVQPAAEAAGVDPRLLLAIARQESRFDRTARSPVGALGLFQLMPYTADALAPRVGIDATDRRVLLHARTSATMAATLTADLLRLFDNETVAAIAAYNAGDERGAGWWKAARDAREDLFVDTIPYSETRNYVRIVYANYARYRQFVN